MTDTVMLGHGYYNAHSELQARVAQGSDAVLDAALGSMALPAAGPIMIADFGSSQGRNSLRPMTRVVTAITARAGPDRDIMVIHTDQPHNDFASLFTLIAESDASYSRNRPQVFSYAAGRSFYERLFPTASLAFGWSAMALHWMSRLPNPVAQHIWITCGGAAEQAPIAQVAAEDWRRFLQHRMAELIPGGQLVLIAGARDETGASGLEPLMDLANGVLRDMVAKGALGAEAYAAMTIPSRPRSRAEFAAPFRDGSLPGLRLEELTIGAGTNPMLERWRADGDADAFAREMTAFFLAAFAPSLFGEHEGLEAQFAARLQAVIATRPAELAQGLVVGTLRVTRL